LATEMGVATQQNPGATPAASSVEARRRMETQRRRDTLPELALRKALWARGLRYRVDYRVLPDLRRRADVAFIGPRVAVFVDGCFWHRCPDHGTTPRANRDWWVHKLDGNVQRDRDTDARLRAAGWLVVRVWEHEITVDAVARVERAVRSRV
jgi:DNA mismatch endonuclease, patch repair protein